MAFSAPVMSSLHLWEASVEISRRGQRGPWRQNSRNTITSMIDGRAPAWGCSGGVVDGSADVQVTGAMKPRHQQPVNVSRSGSVLLWLPRLVLLA